MADETSSTAIALSIAAPASRPSGGHSGHAGPGAGPRTPRPAGGSRRRPWRTQVLPPQEGLQVLHREDRRDLATAMCACCRALSPSAARSFRAA